MIVSICSGCTSLQHLDIDIMCDWLIDYKGINNPFWVTHEKASVSCKELKISKCKGT